MPPPPRSPKTSRTRASGPDPPEMATLTYMPTEHQPVLANELVALLAPQPGELAVDCTFGAGGHARLIADRIGPTGMLVCIDRDPLAERRFAEFAEDAPCETRFIRGDYAEGLEALHGEGHRADMVYLDLGISSMQIDTWERGFSYSYDAPLDMRMDPDQEFSALDLVNEWPTLANRRGAARVRRRAPRERIARAIGGRRPIETTC